MTNLIIHPTYSQRNAAARTNREHTLERDVDFLDKRYEGLISEQQRAQLLASHPEGRARFWGATSSHDASFDRMSRGDLVLFTGDDKVQAVGEVGTVLRSAPLADALWPHEPDQPSWQNIYTVREFRPAEIEGNRVRKLIGYKDAARFQGFRMAPPDRAEMTIDELGLTSIGGLVAELRRAEERLSLVSGDRVVPVEANRTAGSSYAREAAEIEFKRLEAQLVQEYVQQLPEGASHDRIKLAWGGFSDIYVGHEGRFDLVEAKSSAGRHHVRMALAQALDYSSTDVQVDTLSALFPERPAEADVDFLHRFGIDCIYIGDDRTFTREAAPEANRAIWQDSRTGRQPERGSSLRDVAFPRPTAQRDAGAERIGGSSAGTGRQAARISDKLER